MVCTSNSTQMSHPKPFNKDSKEIKSDYDFKTLMDTQIRNKTGIKLNKSIIHLTTATWQYS